MGRQEPARLFLVELQIRSILVATECRINSSLTPKESPAYLDAYIRDACLRNRALKISKRVTLFCTYIIFFS